MDEQERQRKLEELKRQRDELDKLISELTATQPSISSTNIPYTQRFTDVYHPYSSSIDFQKVSPQELLQMKLFVNKKCNQISTDYDHTSQLIDEIMQHKNKTIFKEIFIRKLIDQGRVQVSSHLDSYKPFSFILFKLDDADMINMFVSLLIFRNCNENELKGMYAIYFGYLNLKEDVSGCWFWMASVLNTVPNQFTGYIFEVFLVICSDLLMEKCKGKFLKILKYMKVHFLKEIDNDACKIRLLDFIEKNSK